MKKLRVQLRFKNNCIHWIIMAANGQVMAKSEKLWWNISSARTAAKKMAKRLKISFDKRTVNEE